MIKYKNTRTEEIKTKKEIIAELETFASMPGMGVYNWFAIIKGGTYQLCAGTNLRRMKSKGWKAIAVVKKG